MSESATESMSGPYRAEAGRVPHSWDDVDPPTDPAFAPVPPAPMAPGPMTPEPAGPPSPPRSGITGLLVVGANYILGNFGPDCDLKRFGLKIAARGGKNARKRAKVAVARKLAVLMLHLWRTGEVYDPFYLAKRRGEPVPA